MKIMAAVFTNSQLLIREGELLRVRRAPRDRGSELMNFQCRVYVELLCGADRPLLTATIYYVRN